MPVSEAKKKASRKYDAKTYESLNIRIHKGQREIIKDHAASRGESLAGFMMRAAQETMERDKEHSAQE